jgi:hypothetical protein
MVNRLRKTLFILLLLLFLVVSNSSGLQLQEQKSIDISDALQNDIINQGISDVKVHQSILQDRDHFLFSLEQWYNAHPLIQFASLVGPSMTIKFIDGSYTVLLDPFLEDDTCLEVPASSHSYGRYRTEYGTKAVILNVAEHMYGHRQCMGIIRTLLPHQYSIEYAANQAVDLSYIRQNLSADIVYMNTHAGYFDIDGDHQADAVVIATGEHWTNETEHLHSYDYQNNLIVKGMVADQAVIAFTPAFIDHYYAVRALPYSLVYMATCYALYDQSMAQQFLDAGASVYVGWSNNTLFWTNSITSVYAFRLLACGCTVHQVCKLIGYGGIYNWLFHSKLIYYGEGEHRIPR